MFDEQDEYRMIPPTESSYTRISYPSMQPQTTLAGTMSGGTVLCAGPCRTAWSPRKSAKEHGSIVNAIRAAGWREVFGTSWMCPDCMVKLLGEQHRLVESMQSLQEELVRRNVEISNRNQEIGELKFDMNIMASALKSVESIMNNSNGVEGWHTNGEIATWGELGLDQEVGEALANETKQVEFLEQVVKEDEREGN